MISGLTYFHIFFLLDSHPLWFIFNLFYSKGGECSKIGCEISTPLGLLPNFNLLKASGGCFLGKLKRKVSRTQLFKSSSTPLGLLPNSLFFFLFFRYTSYFTSICIVPLRGVRKSRRDERTQSLIKSNNIASYNLSQISSEVLTQKKILKKKNQLLWMLKPAQTKKDRMIWQSFIIFGIFRNNSRIIEIWG